MNCEKCVDIIYRDSTTTIATTWTGANYYVQEFDPKELEEEAWARELMPSEVIQKVPVAEMAHMCKDEEFSEDLLKEYIVKYLQADIEQHKGL